jgi:hypothetical protein
MVKNFFLNTLFSLLFILTFSNCEDHTATKNGPDSPTAFLYKVTFAESYGFDAFFSISSEFILVNYSDSCIENVRDFHKLNFLQPEINLAKFYKFRFEYCSKGAYDVNSQIAPGDTAFYKLIYLFRNKNYYPVFFECLGNPNNFLERFNNKHFIDGKIKIKVHPLIKLYHSSDIVETQKYTYPFHETLEFYESHADKTPYEILRYKYDHFYSK